MTRSNAIILSASGDILAVGRGWNLGPAVDGYTPALKRACTWWNAALLNHLLFTDASSLKGSKVRKTGRRKREEEEKRGSGPLVERDRSQNKDRS